MIPAIRAEKLSKCYHIVHKPRGDSNLTERLVGGARATWERLRGRVANAQDFWALSDVSFAVNPGEVVGIIGRNGAGKSTLLKVLARIAEPTSGRAEIRGRMGSLLEVGTGFHPELTGRENVYLNGSVLGMSRREITSKFDAIVTFAEVEQFLDTPVKRYSSGMYVRLAFAVAAHLEPEILIVDEVLAVGDAAFQRRCLGKMGEVARAGRTVLLVSHNTAAIRNLCTRALLLNRGRVTHVGTPDEVLATYLSDRHEETQADYDLSQRERSPGKEAVIQRVSLYDSTDTPTRILVCGSALTIEFRLRLTRPASSPQLGIGVDDMWGQRVFSVASYLAPDDLPAFAAGTCRVRCRIPALDLAPGRYSLSLSFGYAMAGLADQVEGVVAFDVEAGDFYGNGRLPSPGLGAVLVRSTWSTQMEEPA